MKKKGLWLVAGIVSSLVLLSGCNGAGDSDSASNVCAISYQYVDESTQTLKEIPDFLFKPDGAYPSEYQEKKSKSVDTLRAFRKDETTVYAFEGWYYDAEYQNKLTNNALSTSTRGDITLYAKIVEREKRAGDVVTASITYRWKELETVREGIDSFPSAMTDGVVLPTEYVEGVGVSLPKLNRWEQSKKVVYEFEGWYFDEVFKSKVVGTGLSSTQTGNLILYANVAIWVG